MDQFTILAMRMKQRKFTDQEQIDFWLRMLGSFDKEDKELKDKKDKKDKEDKEGC